MSNALLDAEEHVLTTLEKDGSRRWLYPRLSPGKFWNARRFVGFALIALFVALPHVRIHGKPAVLLDITARRFTLFGYTFLPTDTLLLALLMISLFLTVFLLTALLGRVWCGWGCPQTVYLEFVYRPIERFFMGTTGRGGVPRPQTAGWRYVAMYAVYVILSMLLAHTFLAYFVGIERLSRWVTQSPWEHPGPFLVMALTTGLMMFDFVFFREQLCLIACPYGRFQSVLLDRDSLIVAYDRRRGEPRGKLHKQLTVVEQATGDCVDCSLCVKTCPTGIDIRNGLQMECIHCTQCIDACDEVMAKVGRAPGLIRYSSQNAIEGGSLKFLRPRVVIYPILLTILISTLVYNIATKKSFDVTLLRNFGNPYSISETDQVQNSLRFKIVNRSEHPEAFTIQVVQPPQLTIDLDAAVTLGPGESNLFPVLATAPRDVFQQGQATAEFEVFNQSGEKRMIQCQILGP